MSGRKKRDYRAVLQAIARLTTERKVERLVLDFEAAMWKAAAVVMPDVEVKGLPFGTSHLAKK